MARLTRWRVSDPNDIRIKELLKRLGEGETKEVILATNPDVEGEATAMYGPAHQALWA